MLSNIGRAAIKRIGGSYPSSNRFLASTWQLQRVEAHQHAAIISRGSSPSLLARRSYATATKSAPAKRAAAKKAPTKKPATKKPAAKKATTKVAAKKPAKKVAKKPVKKKAKAKPKPKPKPKARVKKPLSEAVQAFRTKKKLREVGLIAEEPKLKPISGRYVYLQEKLAGTRGKNDLVEIVGDAKTLSASELERYNNIAAQNRAANDVALKKWIVSYTPDQIRVANNARHALRRLTGKQTPRTIPDDRIPSKPKNAIAYFIKDRYAAGGFEGVSGNKALPVIAAEWKTLAPAQRKIYEDQSAADKIRYWQEVKTVFNREPSVSPPA